MKIKNKIKKYKKFFNPEVQITFFQKCLISEIFINLKLKILVKNKEFQGYFAWC